MDVIPALSIEDVEQIDNILQDYLQKSESDLSVVIDRGGNVISQSGDLGMMDVTIIAALAAGSFAATKELARRIGEVEFNALYHQGNGNHMFMNSIDEDTIMITVFSSQTTVGLVRFYSASAANSLASILQSLRQKSSSGHGQRLEFDASDIAAMNLGL